VDLRFVSMLNVYRRRAVEAVRSVRIGIRAQALSIVLLVGAWVILLTLRPRAENASVLWAGLLLLLPLLTSILGFVVLESRIDHEEKGPWWVYFGAAFALVPWIWYVWVNWSR
jgi:hypothetical protein